MTEAQKIETLKIILSEPIENYKKYKDLQDVGGVDRSYVYDNAYEWFKDGLAKIDYERILEILAN